MLSNPQRLLLVRVSQILSLGVYLAPACVQGLLAYIKGAVKSHSSA